MNRALSALALTVTLALPAQGETALELAPGLYGLPDVPGLTCDENPHEVFVEPDQRHIVFQWRQPAPGPDGRLRATDRYDVLQTDAATVLLYLEGERRPTAAGKRPIWILRLTHDPAGYCFGRTDWPMVQCIDHAQRCDDSAPTS